MLLVFVPFDPDRGGHAGGAMRDFFISAVDTFAWWRSDQEPCVRFGYDWVLVPIGGVAHHMRLCSDVMPGGLRKQLRKLSGINLAPGATYGDGALALERAIVFRIAEARERQAIAA
jgi:hypothetical protein